MSRVEERAASARGEAPSRAPRSAATTFGLTTLSALPVAAGAWALLRLGAGAWAGPLLGMAVAGALGLEARRRLRRGGGRRPWWLHWDVAGYAGTVGLASLATVLAVETLLPAPGLFRTTQVALPVGVAGVAAAAAVGWALARHEEARLRGAARNLVRVWTDPPADWSAFVLGAVLTLPLAALISSVLWDGDSSRLLLSVSRARHEGLGFLTQTHEVFLPVLIYSPVVALAGAYGATAIPVLSMQALAGVVAYIARKLTGGMLAPLGAALTVLAIGPLIAQADVLPLYPLMLALGYLGGWIGLRAIRAEGRARLGFAALAGLVLAATAETHDIGKLFVAVPLFLLALEPTRRGVRGVALIYGALALFYVPRIVVNLAEGGLTSFIANRTDWIVQSGYKRLINAEFWGHPVTAKTTFFAQLLRPYWAWPGGWLVAIPVGLAAVAAATARWRVRLFALLGAGLLLAGLLRTNAPPHARYLSPVLPGLAIAAGVGLWVVSSRWRKPAVAGALALGLVLAAGVSYVATVREAHDRQAWLLGLGLERITERVDDDRAVAGVRPSRLMAFDPGLRMLTARAFTEREWVTYLTWPSDREVLRVLRGRGVGWVVVYTDRRLEVDYESTWVEPTYGLRVRHDRRIARSPAFCPVAESSGFILYRIGTCPG